MDLNFEALEENVKDLLIPDEYDLSFINYTRQQLKTLKISENVEEFYPKNLFTGRMVEFFLSIMIIS